ncbi:MAG: recombinase family protein [Tannerellaceae bacterium]|nr:recombinase family protein [Tannerellaceae bacterium]
MENRTYYYARVSSKEQNLDRQLSVFENMGASERYIITDKESGKDLNRSGYMALKSTMLRRGDTLVVKSLDRLSRNKADIKNELQYFKDNGIRLKVLDLPTTMIDYPEGQEWVLDMVNNILVEVLSSIAQQERETIHQRQAEGIAAARAKGKCLGRPRVEKPQNWEEVIDKWQAKKISATDAMRRTGLKKSTFYNFLREEDNNKTQQAVN